ncbi:hypothetical protein MCB86_22800 [Pseudomonas sp. KSR10]|jgi:hypothetical protein|uniref:Uncharacterized protein n=1 Tax=Stutzerimonas stutzeri TaxID=316 RepID=A0A0D9AZR1_STUST|nr:MULTISPECIES: hypothetical protein [Pseudomonadaceae]KJH84821.1 hypothetical protein UF78_00925 [Stutzerimonas stutzeri]MCG6542910.1 hypothetical protein [Pseudomonas sp. KSR10]
MSSQNETGAVGRRLLRVMAPSALLLWAFVAMGTNGSTSSSFDGRYSSSGYVLLRDGTTRQVSQSLVFNKGRFYSLTRNSPAIVEASGRLETDLLGRASLIVEEGQVHGLGPQDRLDDELMFNLFYGAHKGARISLEQVGACLYGVETQQVYCSDDHPDRG